MLLPLAIPTGNSGPSVRRSSDSYTYRPPTHTPRRLRYSDIPSSPRIVENTYSSWGPTPAPAPVLRESQTWESPPRRSRKRPLSDPYDPQFNPLASYNPPPYVPLYPASTPSNTSNRSSRSHTLSSPPSQHASTTASSSKSKEGPATRCLHIYATPDLDRDLLIKEPAAPNNNNRGTSPSTEERTAYTVRANHGSVFSSKPHMRLYLGVVDPSLPTSPVGTASFHQHSRNIDLAIRERSSRLSSSCALGYEHEFQSATGMGLLKWKRNGPGQDIILMTEGREWVAKYEGLGNEGGEGEKKGLLEISSWGIGGEGLDEIVVSCVAMVEYIRRQRGRSW